MDSFTQNKKSVYERSGNMRIMIRIFFFFVCVKSSSEPSVISPEIKEQGDVDIWEGSELRFP